MSKYQIFISSVQDEFADIRQEIYAWVNENDLLRTYFAPYVFENAAVRGADPKTVYIEAVTQSDVYLMLCGQQYGYEDDHGVSPTEHEYNKAVELQKERWVFLQAVPSDAIHPKMKKLIARVNQENKRTKFDRVEGLKVQVVEAAKAFLERQGPPAHQPWDSTVHPAATLDDIDIDQLDAYVAEAAKTGRHKPPRGATAKDVLFHMKLLRESGGLMNAAVLAFGHSPQTYFSAAKVKCAHYHGSRVAKPLADQKVISGSLYHQIDGAYQFVLAKLASEVIPQDNDPSADVVYEIPPPAIREAIVNALAHRDYTSLASVQVILFADRLEISNPGALYPPLNLKMLKQQHQSYPHNPILARILYNTADIEELGTGTQDIVRLCEDAGLREPTFSIDEGFKITLWRPVKVSSTAPQVPLKYPPSTPQVPPKYPSSTPQVRKLVQHMDGAHSTKELMALIGLLDRKHFRQKYLQPAMTHGYLVMTIPEEPNSSQQQYRLTEEGQGLKQWIIDQTNG